MWSEYVLLTIIGLAGGIAIAGAIFALITEVGVICQIADVTDTTAYVTTYETVVLGGALCGCVLTLCDINLTIPSWLLAIPGIFSGIFVGCLATALAEALNVTTVFTRRIRLHQGIAWIVLSLALGKVFGSLIYFWRGYNL